MIIKIPALWIIKTFRSRQLEEFLTKVILRRLIIKCFLLLKLRLKKLETKERRHKFLTTIGHYGVVSLKATLMLNIFCRK